MPVLVKVHAFFKSQCRQFKENNSDFVISAIGRNLDNFTVTQYFRFLTYTLAPFDSRLRHVRNDSFRLS